MKIFDNNFYFLPKNYVIFDTSSILSIIEHILIMFSLFFKKKMFFFYYFFLSFSAIKQSADLTPPFYPNSKNRLGFWDVSGSAIINEEDIILAPPIQYKAGSAWSTLPLPYGEWSIAFRMRISEGNGGGGFAIPIIDKHGASGNFYGITNQFKGIAVIGAVFADKDGKPELHYKLLQCNKTGEIEYKILDENDKCDSIVKLTDDPFIVNVYINNDGISVTHTLCNDIDDIKCKSNDPITVIDQKREADITRCWIGISAMSDDYTSRFDLFSAIFDTKTYTEKRFKQSREFQHMPTESNIQPQVIHALRNPSFALMRKEFKALENAKDIFNLTERDINYFLKVMDEFAEVIEEVATYSQLNDFIGKTLVPYSEGWHRRTFKVMDTVAKTKSIMSQSFNETKELLTIFNETIEESLKKAQTKIGTITTILQEESEIQLLDWLLAKKENSVLNVLKYVSIGEVVTVVLFYFIQRIPKVKQRFYGY